MIFACVMLASAVGQVGEKSTTIECKLLRVRPALEMVTVLHEDHTPPANDYEHTRLMNVFTDIDTVIAWESAPTTKLTLDELAALSDAATKAAKNVADPKAVPAMTVTYTKSLKAVDVKVQGDRGAATTIFKAKRPVLLASKIILKGTPTPKP